MTIEKIICDLKEINDIEQLQVLICKLEESLNEKNYIKHNSSKRLNGIKRVLNNGKSRPVLNCYTPYKNGYSAITDSYQMYLLKEVKLPFKCAFNSTFNEEEKEKYIEENKVEISNLCYPDIKGILDNIEKYNIIEKLKLDVNEVLKLEKITPKNQSGQKIYTFNFEDIKITLNLIYLKNCIDILQLKDVVEFDFYGENKPLITHNEKDEIGLILPIKIY